MVEVSKHSRVLVSSRWERGDRRTVSRAFRNGSEGDQSEEDGVEGGERGGTWKDGKRKEAKWTVDDP